MNFRKILVMVLIMIGNLQFAGATTVGSAPALVIFEQKPPPSLHHPSRPVVRHHSYPHHYNSHHHRTVHIHLPPPPRHPLPPRPHLPPRL